ncbi:hypothetical protein [Lactobacillus terrae]|uniref:hypothetical protein n=1 Tax=Lactobacillus terrae TaxID=2269374 RepID=UPI000C1B6801|nr:hypothetical protein [Lactobacillus terrae]
MLSDEELNKFFSQYQDRGMKKWQGYHLSDHTASLKKESKVRNKSVIELEQMSLEDITQILSESYVNNKIVSLQTNFINNDLHLVEEFQGKIKGYFENSVFLDSTEIQISMIRNVRLIEVDNHV